MCFEFSFKSPHCLLAPIPPPASWSGAVISLDGEQQTYLGWCVGSPWGWESFQGFVTCQQLVGPSERVERGEMWILVVPWVDRVLVRAE